MAWGAGGVVDAVHVGGAGSAGGGAAVAVASVGFGFSVVYCQLCAAYRFDSMLGGGFRQFHHGADIVVVGYGYGGHA